MNLTCESCRYFVRHYIRKKDRYIPLWEGHCKFPKLKHRQTDTPACRHYAPPVDALDAREWETLQKAMQGFPL